MLVISVSVSTHIVGTFTRDTLRPRSNWTIINFWFPVLM